MFSQGIKTNPKLSFCSRPKEAVLAAANIHKPKGACRLVHVEVIPLTLPQSVVAVLLACRANSHLSLVELFNSKLAANLHPGSPGTDSSCKTLILSKTNKRAGKAKREGRVPSLMNLAVDTNRSLMRPLFTRGLSHLCSQVMGKTQGKSLMPDRQSVATIQMTC